VPQTNKRLRLAPPKVTLATISGIRILPIKVPSGLEGGDALVGARPHRTLGVDAKAVEQSGGGDREHFPALDASAVGRNGEARARYSTTGFWAPSTDSVTPVT
jgi:hypothetical protein